MVLVLAVFRRVSLAKDGFHAGSLYDQFPLTLDSGQRTEAVGPLFYSTSKRIRKKPGRSRLFFRTHNDPAVESREDDFLYPVLTYESLRQEYRWQFFQLCSFAGGQATGRIP